MRLRSSSQPRMVALPPMPLFSKALTRPLSTPDKDDHTGDPPLPASSSVRGILARCHGLTCRAAGIRRWVCYEHLTRCRPCSTSIGWNMLPYRDHSFAGGHLAFPQNVFFRQLQPIKKNANEINAGLARLQVRQTQRPCSVSTILIHGPEYPFH